MKRTVFGWSLSFAIFIFFLSAVQHTVADQKQKISDYIAMGQYDEALQAQAAFQKHSKLFQDFVRLFGDFNATLAAIAILLILAGSWAGHSKSTSPPRIRFTKKFPQI